MQLSTRFAALTARFRSSNQPPKTLRSVGSVPGALDSLENLAEQVNSPNIYTAPTTGKLTTPKGKGLPGSAPQTLIHAIRNSVIGEGCTFEGPFGSRRITYADYTASGRGLTFIEEHILKQIMPYYANTHTEASQTGRQTLQFREDARAIIHAAVRGGANDVVITCGSGSTAAIHRIVDVLRLPLHTTWKDGALLRAQIPTDQRPVVFIGPYEHHSNVLPWRESIAEVVTIGADSDGHINQVELAAKLAKYAHRPLRIGSFSAASNVTGILSDTDDITSLLHQHGALAFWDYAAAAPYVQIDMNPDGDDPKGLRNKDAIFISPHKFIGGPGTPGVLIAKRHLFKGDVPSHPGGGTVAFVTPHSQIYDGNVVHREEGGTPAIVESIRAGLVFQLKEKVGAETIEKREQAYVKCAIDRWSKNPRIRVLGSRDAQRLSIVSFVIDHDDGALHHNFVVALLNDLFGIQARGGCSCAGPYGHELLNINDARSRQLADATRKGYHGLKPGWVRVNFNYFISKQAFAFILDAVDFVAEHGAALLTQYKFDLSSGEWTHRKASAVGTLRLHDVQYGAQGIVPAAPRAVVSEAVFPTYLAEARRLAAKASAGRPPTPASYPEGVETNSCGPYDTH